MALQCPEQGSLSASPAEGRAGRGEGRDEKRAPLFARLRAFALPFGCGLVLVAAVLAAYLWLSSTPESADEAPLAEAPRQPDPAQEAQLAAPQDPSPTAARAGRAAPGRAIAVAREFRITPRDLEAAEEALGRPEAKNHPPTANERDYLAWMKARTSEAEAQLARKWDRSRAIIDRKDLTNQSVLEAFLYAPREFFARSYNAKKAYDDTAIPIGHGQTISGPNMVCAMTNAVNPRPGDRILEVGTGSGYQSSVLAELSDHVYTIEIVAPLQAETDAIYKKLEKQYPEYKNVVRIRGDGYFGLPERAPFQKIIVTAGIDHIPPPLLRQLAPGGIMVIPVGPPSGQTILKIVKLPSPDGGFTFTRQDIYHGKKVIFVPFTSDRGKAHSLEDSSEGGK